MPAFSFGNGKNQIIEFDTEIIPADVPTLVGSMVGDWDVTPEAIERAGAELLLRGVAMKPGMACAYGAAGGRLILRLSGNPASSLTNFCACALPAIRKLCGRRETLPAAVQAVLAAGFRKKAQRIAFCGGGLFWTMEPSAFSLPATRETRCCPAPSAAMPSCLFRRAAAP